MDSMTEMFYDESNNILRSMRKSLRTGRTGDCYGQEVVQELFRGVHTLKADSAMMLYEDLADLSKVTESLLYCFRGEDKRVEDAVRFEKVLTEYIDFFEQEAGKLLEGGLPNGTAAGLEERIKEYTAEMTALMPKEEMEAYQKQISKPRRQIYYISSANEDKKAPAAKQEPVNAETKRRVPEPVQFQEETVESKGEENTDGKKTVAEAQKGKRSLISDDDKKLISQSVRDLIRVVDNLEYALGSGDSGVFSREQLESLQKIQANLDKVKSGLVTTDFVPVAKKMEIVVDEMSEKLDKPVKLLVKGEDTPIDPEKREKISSALIHLIRNSVDHGIEDREERERCGKSPMGLIKLYFVSEGDRVKITVKDDGCGIDTDKVLKAAREKNLLKKPAEEYTEREIYKLMLLSGVTTTKEVNEYSGRGVGMDVINHNVMELGGKLKISSKKGLGTKITMKI